MILTEHFELEEFTPYGYADSAVPASVIARISVLCVDLLEPLREHMGLPVIINSGFRTLEKNKKVGGVTCSDHMNGDAADFHVADGNGCTWEENTIDAFHWLRENKQGLFGQLIKEDHRDLLHDDSKLWVHVSNPTVKHPGDIEDGNRLLVSHAPGEYHKWTA